jgi:hypothetical protein
MPIGTSTEIRPTIWQAPFRIPSQNHLKDVPRLGLFNPGGTVKRKGFADFLVV